MSQFSDTMRDRHIAKQEHAHEQYVSQQQASIVFLEHAIELCVADENNIRSKLANLETSVQKRMEARKLMARGGIERWLFVHLFICSFTLFSRQS